MVVKKNSLHSVLNILIEENPEADILDVRTVNNFSSPLLVFPNGAGVFILPDYADILCVPDVAEYLRTHTTLEGFALDDDNKIKILEKIDEFKLA